jgi:hypothetical protein
LGSAAVKPIGFTAEQTYNDKVHQLKQDTGIDEQLALAESFSFGFLDGASFLGSVDCTNSMNGVVFYGFLVLEYRNVYNPSSTMKAVIYSQKLSEQVTLFYT